MVDRLTSERRSWLMSRVPSKNTGPELVVRQLLHRAGFRYRLHDPRLPGRPDLVLPRWHTVVCVNGCFWHRHGGCEKASSPKSNSQFWEQKFARNVQRDADVHSELRSLGWNVVVVWSCELTDRDALLQRLTYDIRGR